MHIKDAMQAKHISIEAISLLLGVHRNTVANKMTGETPFTMQEGFALKRELFPEYDMEYLFLNDSIAYPPTHGQPERAS